jgi:hypothetical protein
MGFFDKVARAFDGGGWFDREIDPPLDAPIPPDPDPEPDPLPPAYARMMLALLPPGKLWRTVASTLSTFFEACADELGRLHARALDLIEESDPSAVDELLPEYEHEMELASTGSTAERQARVLAQLLARPRYRPVDIRTALAPLLGLDANDLVVIETSHALAVAFGDHREIFRFFVFRDPGLGGDAYYVASAQALLDTISPSHTAGHVIESVSMLYDDPFSLYDRDILGA